MVFFLFQLLVFLFGVRVGTVIRFLLMAGNPWISIIMCPTLKVLKDQDNEVMEAADAAS